MGYYNADELPVYDHLASEDCVVDRWFSSVPGATWPNRLYSVAGRRAPRRASVTSTGPKQGEPGDLVAPERAPLS